MSKTLAVIACLTSSLVLAQTVPGSISFNARLTDTSGAPITGSHAMGFGLYDASTGGAALWTENVSGASFSTEGLAYLELGATTPLTTSALDGRKLYLEISVDGTTMSPRLSIVSVPYAIRASVAATALTVGTLTQAQIQQRVTGTCNAGQAVRSIDATGGVQCENLASGGGDITAVAAGAGLSGGGTTGDLSIGLATCANGEVLKSNGSGWACASAAGATPSGGLAVNGGNVGLQPCAAGEILKSNGTGWACGADNGGGPNGRNLFFFGNNVADWTPTYTGTPFSITTNAVDSQEGDVAFDFAYGDVASSTGIVAVWGSNFIQVDPTKTYEGRIKARSASTTFLGSFWAGFIAYDAAKGPLQGPSSIFLSGPTRCVPFIANAVPNTGLTSTWRQFVGRVTAEGAGNNQFPVGTRYIKPCVGTNLAGIGTTRLDSFEIFEVDATTATAVYTQWGTPTCTAPGSRTLVSGGFAFGNHYTHPGTEMICLKGGTNAGIANTYGGDILYGSSLEGGVHPGAIVNSTKLQCAVCAAPAGTCFVMDGSRTCPTGFVAQYIGSYYGGHYTHGRAGRVCVDVPNYSNAVPNAGTDNANYLYPTNVWSAAGTGIPTSNIVSCAVCCAQ